MEINKIDGKKREPTHPNQFTRELKPLSNIRQKAAIKVYIRNTYNQAQPINHRTAPTREPNKSYWLFLFITIESILRKVENTGKSSRPNIDRKPRRNNIVSYSLTIRSCAGRTAFFSPFIREHNFHLCMQNVCVAVIAPYTNQLVNEYFEFDNYKIIALFHSINRYRYHDCKHLLQFSRQKKKKKGILSFRTYQANQLNQFHHICWFFFHKLQIHRTHVCVVLRSVFIYMPNSSKWCRIHTY